MTFVLLLIGVQNCQMEFRKIMFTTVVLFNIHLFVYLFTFCRKVVKFVIMYFHFVCTSSLILANVCMEGKTLPQTFQISSINNFHNLFSITTVINLKKLLKMVMSKVFITLFDIGVLYFRSYIRRTGAIVKNDKQYGFMYRP